MRFIGRERELTRLDRVAKATSGGLVVIWGRRRVGKTRLLLEWVRRHHGVYWVADESAMALQIRNFAKALEARLPGFGQVEYPHWTVFFSHLAKQAKQANFRGPIVIDELPYLIETSPEFASVLQRFIDHDASTAKLIIAICGSSQRMMQGAVLDSSAPLYGRAKELIKLSPIPAGHIQSALSLSTAQKAVEAYTLWGGIPRYWELAEDFGQDLFGAADNLVLDAMGPLHEEPHRLLLEETPSAISVRPILDAIGLGASRPSEIASRLRLPATSLARPLAKLMELDLVEREVPFDMSEHATKRALYKIKDPFLRFWFETVGPQRSTLSQSPLGPRKKWFEERFPGLCGRAWEELCRSAVPSLSASLGGIDFGPAGRFWHGKGPEWDIVAESLDGKTLLLAEAKFLPKNVQPATIQHVLNGLIAKGIPPIHRNPNAQILYGLFVPSPPKMKLPDHVCLIDAASVMDALL